MVNKLLVIGLTLFIMLLSTSSPAVAKGYFSYSDKNHSHKNTSIQYDESDDGDNNHPSGKDRSIEYGKSKPQGNAQSDPDDDNRGPDRTNGGADQIGSPGGIDKEDQDNNNGCGNDDDFEDDNEVWCGQKPKKDSPDRDDDKNHDKDCDDEDGEVDGKDDGAKDSTEKSPKVKEGEVLGATSLPITGPTSNSYVLVMLSLLAGGSLLYSVSKRLEKI